MEYSHLPGGGSCFSAGIEKLMIGVWSAHTSHSASGDRLEGVRKLESVLVCAPPLIACTHPVYVPTVHTSVKYSATQTPSQICFD